MTDIYRHRDPVLFLFLEESLFPDSNSRSYPSRTLDLEARRCPGCPLGDRL
jgi:hypothetical protein